MSKDEVIALMESSRDEDDWNRNCDTVKRRCEGYPPFWYAAVIVSGLAARTAASWARVS